MSENNNHKIKVLYVDDEKINLQAFRTTFKYDFDILLASSAKEARQLLSNNRVDIIISDQRMPDETGTDFLGSIKDIYPDPIRLLLTAYSDNQTVLNAVDDGVVYHYLTKPWDDNYLKNIVKNAYEVYALRKQIKNLQKDLFMLKQELELALRQQTT